MIKFTKEHTVLFLRLTTLCLFLVVAFDFFTQLFFMQDKNRTENIISTTVFIAIACCAAIFLVGLIFIPHKLSFYATFCWVWSLTRLIDDGSTLNFSLYLLGFAFAYKQGFFEKYKKFKIVSGSAILITAVASQYRYGIYVVLENIFYYFETLLTASIAALLFLPRIQTFYKLIKKEEGDNQIALKKDIFSQEDVEILQKIIFGEKYDAIAAGYDLTPNAFKKRVHKLYTKLEVSGLKSFLARYGNCTLSLYD